MSISLLNSILEQNAIKYANNIAVTDSGRRITYQELNSRANQLANLLLDNDVTQQQVVAVWSSGYNADLVAANAAVFKIGAIYLPMDANSPLRRNQHIVVQTQPSIYISSEADLSSLNHFLKESDSDGNEILIINIQPDNSLIYHRGFTEERQVATTHDRNPGREILAESGAYLFFTSGSTGVPKGVLGAYDSLAHFIDWEIKEYGLDHQVQVSQLVALSFDASLRDIWVPLCCGGTLHIPHADIRPNPHALMQWMAQARISLVHTVPSFFRLLTNAIEEEGEELVKSLKLCLNYILLSGEPVYAKDISLWKSVMGDSVEMTNLYGPTETTMVRTFHRIKELPQNPAQVLHAGMPIADTLIAVLNNGHVCAEGETGEIYIKTPYWSKGYYNQLALTDKVFIPNPLTNDAEDLVYRTGDMGRVLSSGNLEVLGRLDSQVKVNGIRVELPEIELIVRQLDGVDETLILSRKNDLNQIELICYYTGKAYEPLELQTTLGEYFWQGIVPTHFIHLTEFPLMVNGKVDRKSLPRPEQLMAQNIDYKKPQGEIEEKLHELFCTILGMEQVSREQSFGILGGSSLKVIQLIARVSKHFDITLTIKEVFSHNSIRDLAQYISGKEIANELKLTSLPLAEHHELSHAQKRIWILNQIEKDFNAYNMSFAVNLSGKLDISALQKAFVEIVRKHKSLHTSFLVVDGEPRQKVDRLSQAHELQIIDTVEQSDAWVEFQINKASQQVFDLSVGPLYSARLYRRSADKTVLFFVIHHIIFDGYSYRIFIDELSSLYNHNVTGSDTKKVEELIYDYKDYAHWQNQRLTLGKFQEDEVYWKTQFETAPPRMELPMDLNRSSGRNYHGKTLQFELEPEVAEILRSWQQTKECNLLTVLISSLQVLFYRYTHQQEMVFGTLVAGRELPELESQIGYYVNTLAIKTCIPEAASIDDLLRDTKERILTSFDHQYYPFDMIEEVLDLESTTNRGKLFDVMVILQSQEIVVNEETLFQELIATDFPLDKKNSKFDLTFNFFETVDQITLQLEYSRELFSDGWIERMFDHYQQLILSASKSPDQLLRTLDYLQASEKESLYQLASGDQVELPGTDFTSLFLQQVAQHKDKIAVCAGDQILTYEQLDQLSNQIAAFFHDECGVSKGSRVAFSAERDTLLLASMLAIWKLNAIYLPIDPANPAKRIEQVLADASPSVVITESNTCDFDGAIVIAPSELKVRAAQNSKMAVKTSIGSYDIAYILYTSGSTGIPKGVEIHHLGMLNHLMAKVNDLQICGTDKIVQNASIGFDISIWQAISGLLTGASTYIYTKEETLRIPDFLQRLHLEKVTILEVVPSYLQAICEVEEIRQETKYLDHFRLLMVTGEALPFKSLQKWFRLYPTIPIVNAYGPTEASDDVTHHWFNRLPTNRKIPIGRPLQNLQVLVLDNDLQLCPKGVVGEICVTGYGVAQGYLNRPEQTQAVFVDNPHDHDGKYNKMYKTGDLGRVLQDGSIEFLGRKDLQVKYKGNRIELAEIEHHLLSFKGIDGAVVVMANINDQDSLVAFLVSNPAKVKLNDVKTYLIGKLPPYMIPEAFDFIETLPLTENGKVDRKSLLGQALELKTKFVENIQLDNPGKTERQLIVIWQDILSINDIGLDDNFFHLGGHSLRATKMYTAIYKTFGVLVELAEIFNNPTVRILAQLIEGKTATVHHEILPLNTQQDYVLSHMQQKFWMSDKVLSIQTNFNNVDTLAYHGNIDELEFRQTMQLLIQRHDMLRASFKIAKGEPRLIFDPDNDPEAHFDFIDVSDESDPTSAVKELAVSLVSTNFDLEQGETFRVLCVRMQPEYHVLLLSMHHIISDGWSLQVLAEDFLTIFSALRKNNKMTLEPLPIQYQDYAAWHNEMIEYGLQDAKTWWRNRFPVDFQPARIPGLKTIAEERSLTGQACPFVINGSKTKALLELAVKEESTLFILMQTIIKVWIYNNTRQEHVVLATPVAGRTLQVLENQIGPFIQVVPLLSQINGNESFSQLIQKVRQDTLESFKQQLYPADLAFCSGSRNTDVSTGSYTVGFTLHNQIEKERIEKLEDQQGWSSYDLSNVLTHTSNLPCDIWIIANMIEDEISCSFMYNSQRFNQQMIENYIAQLLALADDIVANLDQSIVESQMTNLETNIDQPIHIELDL